MQQINSGVMYPGNTPQPKYSNPLSQEKIKQYSATGGGFSLKVSQEELDKAVCTHRNPATRDFTLIQNNDGSVTCTICGATFNPDSIKDDQVQEAVDVILNMLQSSKMMYLDIPEQVCAQYYQMIPFIQKFPQLYKIAVDNYLKYQGYNNNQVTYGNGNAIQQYNMMTGYGYAPVMQPMMMNTPVTGYVPNQAPQAINPYAAQQMNMVAGAPTVNPFMAPPTTTPPAMNMTPVPDAAQHMTPTENQPVTVKKELGI